MFLKEFIFIFFVYSFEGVHFLVLQSHKTKKALLENNINKNKFRFSQVRYIYVKESIFLFCKLKRPKKDSLRKKNSFFWSLAQVGHGDQQKNDDEEEENSLEDYHHHHHQNHLHNKKEKGNKSQLMNMTTSKNTMSALYTQPTLIAS